MELISKTSWHSSRVEDKTCWCLFTFLLNRTCPPTAVVDGDHLLSLFFCHSLPTNPVPDPFEAFIIFSIRHEIRRIDLHKRDYSLLVPGLRNTIALDFHFNRSLLYWTDVVEDKIYRGRLSDTGGKSASGAEDCQCVLM